MIKKFFLYTIICCFIISCGKKGDPVYKQSKKDPAMHKILIKKA